MRGRNFETYMPTFQISDKTGSPAIVIITFAFAISTGLMLKMSCEKTTRSATFSGSIEPLILSSWLALFEPTVCEPLPSR